MSNKISKSKDVGANVAGIGGGTLILELATNLPDTNSWKSWLIILAPAITVLLSVFWKWLWGEVVLYIKTLKFNKAKSKIERLLKNNATSSSHKEKLKKVLEKLELEFANYRTSTINIE